MKRLLTISFLLLAVLAHGQSLSPWGQNFWVSFMPVQTINAPQLKLHITTKSGTTVTITNPITQQKIEKTTLIATTMEITVPTSMGIPQFKGVSGKGLKISSNNPVKITASYYASDNGLEATSILPESYSGRLYTIISDKGYNNGKSSAIVVATQNNTLVKVTPSVNINTGGGTLNKGISGTYTINKGEVFYFDAVNTNNDISGTFIEVDEPGKKIVVYAGVTNTRIPNTCGNQSNIIEQILPAEMWGKKFVATPTGASANDIVKVVATENNTTVKADGVTIGTINKGEFMNKAFTNPVIITTDKPTVAALLMIGNGCTTNGNGAPSLSYLMPWSLISTRTDVQTPAINNNISINKLSVIIPTVGKALVKLDGTPIFPHQFTAMPGDTNLSYTTVDVTPGNHIVEMYYGAAVYSFGYGANVAYSSTGVGEIVLPNQIINSYPASEFWSSFHWDYEENPSIDDIEVSYIMSSKEDCKGKIYNPNTGWSDVFSLKAGVPLEVSIPPYQAIAAREGKSDRGIGIAFDKPAQVYAKIRDTANKNTAITNLIPLSNYALDYLHTVIDSSGRSILVVGTEDGTEVEIRPHYNTGPQPPISIELDKGEVYMIQDTNTWADLTGTTIKTYNSCKKVAVFGGGSTDNVHCKAAYTIQQMHSPFKYGQKFIIPHLATTNKTNLKITGYYDVSRGRIKSGVDSNDYWVNSSQYDRYSYFNNSPTSSYTYIDADTPVQIHHYNSSAPCNSGYGAFMSEVYGVENMQTYAAFKVFEYTDSAYINIVTTTNNINLIKLNNVAIHPARFNIVSQDTNYSFARIKVPNGNFVLESDSGYNAFVYAVSNHEGYGYSLGYDVTKRLKYDIETEGATIANVPDLPNGGFNENAGLISICSPNGILKIKSTFSPRTWYYEIDDNGSTHPGFLKQFGASFGDTGLHTLRLVPECELDTFSANIKVAGYPEVDAGNDTMVCLGDTVPLHATGGVKFWWWNYRSVSEIYKAQPYTIGKFDNILGVFITDTNNCTNFDLVSIGVVDSALVIPYFEDTVICYGDSILIGAVGGEGDISKYTYYWDHGLGGQVEHMVNPDTTTTYRVIGIYPCGNLEPDTAYITVNVRKPLAVTPILSDTSICEGDTLFLTGRGIGGDTTNYQYVTENGTTTDSIQFFTPNKSTTIWLQMLDGCSIPSDTAYADINVIRKDEKLSVELTGDTFLCKGERAYVKAIGKGGQSSGYTYSWNNGLPPYQEHTIRASTGLLVRVTLTDGCVNTPATDEVSIKFRDPISINPIDDVKLCAGDSIKVTASGEGSDENHYLFNWSHNLGDGDEKIIPGTQSKKITVTLSDDCGDEVKTNFNLEVESNPIADFEVEDDVICAGGEVRFKDLSVIVENPTDYDWSLGDGSTSTEKQPKHKYNTLDTFDVSLKLTSPFGCADSTSKPAYVSTVSGPKANFIATPDSTDIRTPDIEFTDKSVDAIYYTWHFGDGTIGYNKDEKHTYSAIGSYNVTQVVENIEGCVDSFSSTVFIDDFFAFYMPNAFRPDGDDRNDVFKPAVSGIRKYNMEIYNRWGELLFKTTDSKEGWDGTYKGLKVQQGVYVYIIYLVDKDRAGEVYKGSFMLLR